MKYDKGKINWSLCNRPDAKKRALCGNGACAFANFHYAKPHENYYCCDDELGELIPCKVMIAWIEGCTGKKIQGSGLVNVYVDPKFRDSAHRYLNRATC